MGLFILRSSAVQGGGDEDWEERSAGAIFADRLDSQQNIDAWEADDGTSGHITLDTSIKPTGSTGSTKFSILNTDETASGQLSIPLTAFGEGATRWISFRVYFDAQDAYAPYPTSGSPAGPKICILSRDGNGAAPTGSNQVNEIVVDLMTGGTVATGEINGYWQTGGDPVYGLVEVAFASQLNGSDFRGQSSLDRGANPLSGTNPDSGAAWSASEQERARYGNTYGARSSPGVANFKPGLGDPFQGSFRPRPGEWLTITMRVIVGTWEGGDSRWTLWAARDGEAYALLWDKQNINLGDGPDFNGLNLLCYTTDRDSGGRKVSARGGELASCFEIWNVGPTHATGVGTLAYTAATGRFTWNAAGDSPGTARGISVANDILAINLISSTAANYINGVVTPANLPGGDTSESVTIATDRPDTQRNYADFIFSASAINAPGGFAPAVSALGQAAAGMASGDWLTFSMGSLTDATFHGETAGSAFENIGGYGSRLLWDPIHKKLSFVGTTHTGGANVSGAGGLATWDDATNTWSRETYTWSSEDPGHAYQQSCVDPSGNIYFRSFNSTNIYERPYGDTGEASWDDTLVADIGGDYGNQVAGGLEWFPDLNSGNGGLVFVDVDGANWTNAALSSWSTQAGDSTSGAHDQNIAYAGGFIYWGGGGSSTALYRLTSAGAVSSMAALPFAANHSFASDGGDGAFIAAPDGVGLLLFEAADSGALHYFNGSTWTQLTDHQIEGTPFLVGSIPEYGVVVTIELPSTGTGTPVAKLFKP